MKICYTTSNYPPTAKGGGEISLSLLAERIAKGHEVTVLSFDGNKEGWINGVKVRRLPILQKGIREIGNLDAYWKIRNLEKFDLIHGYNMFLYPLLGYLTERKSLKTVATLNNYKYFNYEEIGIPAPRGLLKKAYFRISNKLLLPQVKKIGKFICLSNSVKKIYKNRGFEGKNLKVIPNMIDPLFNGVNKISHKEKRILFVGMFYKAKGVEYLIKSMKYIKNRSVKLWLVGDGPQKKRLEKLTKKLGLSNKVVFKGKKDYEELPNIYAKCDIFVHPGVWPEPFGRTLLEAMQVGLPVIATDIGGPGEVIPQKELLCESKNPKDLARKIKYLLNNSKKIQKIIDLNRRYVLENYNPENIVNEIIEVYKN